jgi:hypothetical protein
LLSARKSVNLSDSLWMPSGSPLRTETNSNNTSHSFFCRSDDEDDGVAGDDERAALPWPRPWLRPRPLPDMVSSLQKVAARVGERGTRVCVGGTMRDRPFYRPVGGGGAVALINTDTES